MAYCVQADIGKYLAADVVIQLADDDADGVADAAVVAEAIAAADAEIDAYIGDQYTTPFTTVPAILRRLSALLAINHLYLRRIEAEMPAKWESEVKAVRKMLDRIAGGSLQLGDDASGGECGDYPATSRGADEMTMGMGELAGF